MSLNFVTFNQDHSHLAVTTTKGFRIYTTDPFSQVTQSRHGNIAMLEMLFSTSLVATVTQPRRLQLSNTKRQTNICELTFPTTILAVKLNRKRLAIVLEEEIYIYNFADMKLLKIIETSPNPTAICSLSSSSDNCYLAYPSPRKGVSSVATQPAHTPPGTTNSVTSSGDVLLFDATKMQAVNVVTAHKNPLSYVTLNNSGTLLATASDKGTVIRVFSVPEAQKLYQFRRGSMPSRIFCMSFNPTSSLLCVSSATDTVHVFKLVAPPQEGITPIQASTSAKPYISSHRDRSLSPSSAENPYDSQQLTDSTQLSARKHNGTIIGMLRRTSQTVGSSIANVAGGYLPSAVSEIWEPTRDFAWCKIPRPSNLGGDQASLGASPYVRTVVAMSASSPQVMVVSSTGHFYIFAIDLEKGGEGTLIKVYEIGSEAERMSSSIGDD